MSLEVFSLANQVALITGSTQGIGKALAEGLAKAGARVVINGRSEQRVAATVSELTAMGLAAQGVAFDVTQEGEVESGIDEVLRRTGRIDILLNNAGGTVRRKIQELRFEEWKQVLDINLDGAFLLSRSVVGQMIDRQQGKIINICSLMSHIARQENTPYAASKGGMRMFTKALAVELGPQNIQVNGIAPGYFETPLTRPLRDNQEFNRWLCGRTPMARWGKVNELVGAAVYLASPASSFVSGQILYVDGGFSAAM